MRVCRIDPNQPDIVAKLRKFGCSVAHTHTLGDGFPDIVVGYNGLNFMFEIKNPLQPPSKRRLTPDEVIFHDNWKGTIHVIESFEDAFSIIQGR